MKLEEIANNIFSTQAVRVLNEFGIICFEGYAKDLLKGLHENTIKDYEIFRIKEDISYGIVIYVRTSNL